MEAEPSSRFVASHAFLGAAGHASDVLGALEMLLLDDGRSFDGVDLYADGEVDLDRFVGRPAQLAGSIEDALAGDTGTRQWILAAGYPKTRRSLAERVGSHSLTYATVIHSRSTLGTMCTVEPGVVVLAGAAISPRVHLGRHVVVSQTTSVGHDTVLGPFCSVMPTACVSGDCVLGEAVLVGSGAFIAEKTRVGDGAEIGAGAVVLHDVEPGTTVVGAPARPVEPRR